MAAPVLDPRSDAFWESRGPVVFANPRDAGPAAAAASLLAAGTHLARTVEAGKEEGLIHFFTSGSSGQPKIAGFTRAALLASARGVNAFLGVTPADVWLRVLPRFHVGGFGVEARAWAAGARCVGLDERWNPLDFPARCEAERITLASLVPTQVFDLVQAGRTAPPSVRAVLVGGGELRPALYEQAQSLGWPVRASYGLTEAASTVAAQAADEPDCTRLTLLPHWQARTDADGILELRGPALADRVATIDPESGRARWHRIDTLRTSDRVQLADETLVFLGRADRVVKRLGELVDLAQLERCLADAALAAGVFGRVRLRCETDPRAGCRFVLECLEPAEGAAAATLFDAVQPAYARLAAVETVADLRLSPLGKPLA